MGLLSRKPRKKEGSSQKNSNAQYDIKKYVFVEPFIVFNVIGVKEKKLRKIAETKALYYFNTKDFYYAYKKIGKDKWIVLCAVNSDWDNKDVVKDIEGKYPLLLHLKEGKYGIRGERVVYNVIVSEEDISVKIYNFMLEDYREPRKEDILPPSSKFIWSLKRKNFEKVILYLIVLNIFSLLVFGFSLSLRKSGIEALKSAYKTPVKITKRIRYQYVKSNVMDVFSIVNEVSNKIQGIFYITKFKYDKNGRVIFKLACVKNKCLPPFPGVRFDPKTREYIYVYRKGKEIKK